MRRLAGQRGGMKVFVLNDPRTPEDGVRGRGRRPSTTERDERRGRRGGEPTSPELICRRQPGGNGRTRFSTPFKKKRKKEMNKAEGAMRLGGIGAARRRNRGDNE